MSVSSISCSRCQEPLPPEAINTPAMTSCLSCGSALRVLVFPAALKPVETGRAGDLILVEGEAGCFYHPEKKAAMTCSHCGRFLCSLCDVEINGEHLCPPCIETGKKKGKLSNLENHRVRHDDVALAIAILPLFFYCVVPLTSPISLYYAIRHWNSPGTILPRTRIRFVVAMIFAVIEIVTSVVLIYFFATQRFK